MEPASRYNFHVIYLLLARDPIEHSLRQVEANKAAAVAILRHLPTDDGRRPLVGEAALEVDVLVAHVVEALVWRDAVPMLPLATAGEQLVTVDGTAPASKVEPRRVAELEALVADAQPSPAEEVRRAGRSVHRVKVEALAAPPAC